MVVFRRYRIGPGLAILGLGFGIVAMVARAQAFEGLQDPSPTGGTQDSVPPPPQPLAPPPLVGPRTEVEPLPEARDAAGEQRGTRETSPEGRRVESAVPDSTSERVYVTNEPPPPIAERPSGERPDPKAVWTSGYWEWDPDAAASCGSPGAGESRPGAWPGCPAVGHMTPEAGSGPPVPGFAPRTGQSWRIDRPGGTADHPPNTRRISRLRPPGRTSSTSRAIMSPLPMATAWPGSQVPGPPSSQDGTGSRLAGSDARTAGTTAKATGPAIRPQSSSSAARCGTATEFAAVRM